MNSNIPFLDLVAHHLELQHELTQIFQKALRTAGFIGGPIVEDFENAFAQFCGAKYAAGVGSGTDALRFALIACGVKAGDVVVTVPNTFIATTEAISQAGAHPEFVDIDARSYNMDSEKLREYLELGCNEDAAGRLVSRRSGRPVTAVVPVHLYGQMADMDAILELAGKYGLQVIEDACQAHGAEYFSRKDEKWHTAGSMGHAAAFSFYPGKNLGACGEAGAVTTNDLDVAAKVKMIRDHGQAKKYYHDMEGYNGRLDAIQAGILTAKLKHLPRWNSLRRQAADCYRELIAKSETAILPPFEPSWSKAVYHLYVVQSKDREALREHLTAKGVGIGIHYPIPLHSQKAYSSLAYVQGDFPVTEETASAILSLPMFPNLTREQQLLVVREIENLASREHVPMQLASR